MYVILSWFCLQMAWYMAFPVVMFWIFNRPAFYEKIMYETKVSKIIC